MTSSSNSRRPAGWLRRAGFLGAMVASTALWGGEPPPAWRCLSAVAWQQEQEFQKPANDEQAFRRGPFDLPLSDAKIDAGKFMPWPAAGARPEVSAMLAQGLKHLHALDDESAERCFRDAARQDPNCAATWLGLTIANEKLPSRAVYFLDKAAAAAVPATPEAAWVESYKEFFQSTGSRDLTDRLTALAARLEGLSKGSESQPGAAAMALRYRILASHISGLPVPDAEGRDEQLQKWTSQAGGDLLLPYTLLLWTKSDPAKAASHSAALVKRWPQPAMQRLAAEPLLAQGRLKEALPYLEAAVDQGQGDFRSAVLSSSNQAQQRFDHAATLVWSLYHAGETARALQVSAQLLELPRKPGFTGLEAVDDDPHGVFVEALRLRAQLLMATGAWQELGTWMTETTPGADSLMLKLQTQYHAMLAASALWQKEQASKLRLSLRQTADLIQATPYLNRHGPVAMRMVRGADAFDGLCQGRVSPFLKDATEVPATVLAAKLAAAGAKDGALAMVEDSLKAQPGSLPLKKVADSIRSGAAPESQVKNAEGVSGASSGAHPTPQPPLLALPDKLGQVHDLAALRGRPLLVIFFLGGGCPHCVEQLQKFRPQVPAFNEAGIEVITVSTDKVEELEQTLGKDPAINPDLPFLILADPGLATFKTWKCHDDFLNKPLHGTFLLDGEGRVLWSDVSHDPYIQAAYLLGESRRLLHVGR